MSGLRKEEGSSSVLIAEKSLLALRRECLVCIQPRFCEGISWYARRLGLAHNDLTKGGIKGPAAACESNACDTF